MSTKNEQFTVLIPQYNDGIPFARNGNDVWMEDAPYNMVNKIGSEKAHDIIDAITADVKAFKMHGTVKGVRWIIDFGANDKVSAAVKAAVS